MAYKRQLTFRWTSLRSISSILLFVALAVLLEFWVVTFTLSSGARDETALALPLLDFTVSPLYHILPATVVIVLTFSFTHFVSHMGIRSQSTKPSRRQSTPSRTRKRTHFKGLRGSGKRLRKAFRSAKARISKVRISGSAQRQVALVKPLVKGALTVLFSFIAILLLLTVAAYPALVASATVDFLKSSGPFLGFITATRKASESAAHTLSPIGSLATTIQNSLDGASPSFHDNLESVASTLTANLVALSPAEKYLATQNAAVWLVALAALIYVRFTGRRAFSR